VVRNGEGARLRVVLEGPATALMMFGPALEATPLSLHFLCLRLRSRLSHNASSINSMRRGSNHLPPASSLGSRGLEAARRVASMPTSSANVGGRPLMRTPALSSNTRATWMPFSALLLSATANSSSPTGEGMVGEEEGDTRSVPVGHGKTAIAQGTK